uniref:ARID domain-containing protein n=2 Tax=Schistosoma mansoni TaxID=6183 RepID=A0A5K4F347_SCHMA
MNKNRRSSSCPTLIPQTNRTLRREVSNNKRLLKRIQRHYHRRLPRLLGKPIKLSDLFVAVVSRGGYKRVCDRRWWLEVARELKLPSECANASVGLRRIYYQFLSHFEFKEYPSLSEQFLVQTLVEPDIIPEDITLPLSSVERNLGIGTSCNRAHITSVQSAVDLFDQSHRFRFFPLYQDYSYSNKEIPRTGQDNDIFDANSNADEFPDVFEPSQLRLVESALCSGLPNEIEVALNSLLVLSITPSSGSSTSVRLAHCTNLLSLLVASVGIYGEDFGSYISCDETWGRQNQLNFLKFWYSVVREPSGRIFLRPDVFINTEYTIDEIGTNEEKAMHELFTPYSNQYCGTHWPIEGFEGSRVLLIATILVNLVTPPPVAYASVVEDDDDELDFGPIIPCNIFPNGLPLVTWRENARVIAGSPNALRFIFLCAYAHHSGLRSLGLQLLSSIRYPLDPPSLSLPLECPEYWTPLIDNGCRLGQLTLAFLTRCILESNDRCDLIAGLMFLANLTKVREKTNLSSLLVGLPQTVWPRLAQLLCLPDLAVVCATLEALRCLTNLDATMCLTCWESCCLNVNSFDQENIPFILLQPLLALLTLEGQAMGSQSLHRIRLLPRTPQAQNVQPQPPHGAGLRIPALSRVSPNVNELNRSRDAPAYTNGQMLKSSLRPKLPVVHPVPSDSFDNNDIHNSTTSSFRNLKFESSTYSKQPAISSTSTCISHPVYRPQSGSTACSGLINLLSSVPPASSSPNTNMPVINSTSPNSPKVVTPSLSELTDRLQMPPPSLPPPSAMRRSIKRTHSRTSLISSPTQPTDAVKINSSSLCRTNYSSGNMNVTDRISSTSLLLTNSCNLTSQPQGNSAPLGVSINSKEIQQTEKHEGCSEKFSDESLNQINNSRNLLPHLKPIVTYDTCNKKTTNNNNKDELGDNDEIKPIVNGEKSIDPIMDGGLKSSINSFHTNGLRTGILQEAVLAIQDRKLKQTSEQCKSIVKCVNGVLETKRELILSTKDNSNMDIDSNDGKSTPFDVCENSSKKLSKTSLSNGYLTDEIHENEKDNNSLCENNPLHIASSGNGNINNNENSGKLEKNSNSRFRGLHSSHRFLKRRRKWGSKSRLFTPKRRRDLTSKHIDCSPTLHVPLTFNPVPGSVLDPTWKQPTDPVSVESPSGTSTSSSSSEVIVEPSSNDNKNSSISKDVIDKSNKLDCDVSVASESSERNSESGNASLTCSDNPSKTVNIEKPVLYLCEWECCTATFELKHQVAFHVYSTHLPSKENWKVDGSHHTNHKYPVQLVRRCCRWRGCQSASLARAPYALMTHVLDMHCSPRELEARRSNHEKSKTDYRTRNEHFSDVNSSIGDTHPEYPLVGDRTGWGIIRSVEAKNIQTELLAAQHHFLLTNPHYHSNISVNPLIHSGINNPPREGPVTKHLRVTSALILKNLAVHVDQARRWLLKESQLLSEIAFGCTPSETGLKTNNASHIIAQCLSICTLKQNPTNCILSHSLERSINIPLLSTDTYSSSRIQPNESTMHQFKQSTVDLDSETCN